MNDIRLADAGTTRHHHTQRLRGSNLLGGTATNAHAFSWEREAKVYVCEVGFTAERVRDLLVAKLAECAPHVNAVVAIEHE